MKTYPVGNECNKRQKLECFSSKECHDSILKQVYQVCLSLFSISDAISILICHDKLPTRNDLNRLKTLFETNGFRTSLIMSPRHCVSIYRDSCVLSNDECCDLNLGFLSGKSYLVTMLGLHPNQVEIENMYSFILKDLYCMTKFIDKTMECYSFEKLSHEVKNQINLFKEKRNQALEFPFDKCKEAFIRISSSLPEMLVCIMNSLVECKDLNLRLDQMQREYDQILFQNCSFTNALAQLFLSENYCTINKVYFKRSDCPRYERFTIYLYDPEIDELKPSSFSFVPSLTKAILEGPEAMCQEMISSFWQGLLEFGYYASPILKNKMTPSIFNYFMSGVTSDPSLPLLLNSHFDPTFPLSFYFYADPGTGKSALVKNLSPALNYALNRTVDAEILVRFVKQNLNKPLETLKLEMELRPNNNDLSVMSIIQGRRMTLSQTKPGLVVVDLEEMAKFGCNANPDQLSTAKLISMRFSGRNGKFSIQGVPRNSGKRGISGDSTLLALFTSNYCLEESSLHALQSIETFANLQVIHMRAVEDEDRKMFAKSYVLQSIERFIHRDIDINASIPVGTGDTRPLVRYLRILAFYTSSQLRDIGPSEPIKVELTCTKDSSVTYVRVNNRKPLSLRLGEFGNWYPENRFDVIDPRAETSILRFQKNASGDDSVSSKLMRIVDLYFAKSLAPTVIISNNFGIVNSLCCALASEKDVHFIPNIRVKETKMMKSLYDPSDLPNLKDDIMKFGKGAFVVIQLLCADVDDQLCIREIIEDSPSMSAFSSEKSALYKEGLLLCIHVNGVISPEVQSRASLII